MLGSTFPSDSSPRRSLPLLFSAFTKGRDVFLFFSLPFRPVEVYGQVSESFLWWAMTINAPFFSFLFPLSAQNKTLFFFPPDFFLRSEDPSVCFFLREPAAIESSSIFLP